MGIDAIEAASRGQNRRSHALATFPKERFASVTSSLSAAIARLASPEAVDAVLRPAAYAGAQVIYAELRAKVPVHKGVLKESLYRWHDKNRSKLGKSQIYMVGPNKQEARHWANVEFGHWRYNRSAKGKWLRSKIGKGRGPSAHGGPGALKTPVWVPAHPYLRPTWEAHKADAVRAMRTRAMERLRDVMAGRE